MGRILIIDDDPGILRAFAALLARGGHEFVTDGSVEAALERVRSWRPDVVVMDVQLPGMSGLQGMQRFREILGRIPIVIMTGAGSMDVAVEASRHGAWEYRLKPFDPGEMLQLIDSALEWSTKSLRGPEGSAPDGLELGDLVPPGTMAGHGPRMQQVFRDIGRVAANDTTVLIRGESGTGKELVARAIHRHSARGQKPLVIVNCVAIPESLLETELFGHERGAFTGAVGRHIGRFEKASGGTIVLDEIGDLPLGLQGKILRVLQERTFERVGGSETLRNEARVLAATNRDLETAMRRGVFREDLYHRLNVVTISLPSLREHREDLPEIVRLFLLRLAQQAGVSPVDLPRDAMEVLESHDWPGNVRELEHCLERAMVFSRGFPLGAEDVRRALRVATAPSRLEANSLPEALEPLLRRILANPGERRLERLCDEFESLVLREALRQSGGRQSVAARLLGLPRPTLHAKMQRHGIQLESRVRSGAEDDEENAKA